MKLYEIANEYQEIFNLIDNDEVEKDQALAKLDELNTTLESKAQNVAKYINYLKSCEAMIAAEEERLEKKKQLLRNRRASMVTYLESNMLRCGITKIDSPLFTIAIKNCPYSVHVLDENIIPDEYRRIKTEVTLDKHKIKSELQAGVIIPGVDLIQNRRLEIK